MCGATYLWSSRSGELSVLGGLIPQLIRHQVGFILKKTVCCMYADLGISTSPDRLSSNRDSWDFSCKWVSETHAGIASAIRNAASGMSIKSKCTI